MALFRSPDGARPFSMQLSAPLLNIVYVRSGDHSRREKKREDVR